MSDDAPQAALPPSEGGVEGDDLNTTTIVMVGLISTALVLASALGVQALYEAYVKIDSAAKAKTHQRTEEDSTIIAQDSSLMGPPHEIAGQPGVYSLPIDRAMNLVLAELASDSPSNEQGDAAAEQPNDEASPEASEESSSE
ncbi:hypothetical protein Pla123a_09870 [Posidoniimonas polymericola]|uniref:Uncharacterized protein n=1 Tax=Posidoniimonas polymericola TaxID=2528002 RepID=A0A5C5YUA3_9BACT|nr:hypothetical protein [Posidoniimonas polymericola]TWT78197.1 hypothetical protein Pla123a_09870 [Posidoniimonas polymericola]